MRSTKKYKLYTDGGARGNPGKAAIGGLLYKYDDSVLKRFSLPIGHATNNQAEYKALMHGLDMAVSEKIRHLDCFLDSELIVNQLIGNYRVKNKELIPLYREVVNLSEKFKDISFHHVRREKNSSADALVNKALDAN